MTGREPTGPEINDRKWATDDPAWADRHMKYRSLYGMYAGIGLFILSYVVIFIIGLIVGRLICG